MRAAEPPCARGAPEPAEGALRRAKVLSLALAIAAVAPTDAFELRHGQRWGSEEGLPHNSVYALAQDADGFVWIGTPDGLARFDGEQFLVHRADATDPSALRHPVIRSLAAAGDGGLWVGTDAGLDRLARGAERFTRVELERADGASPRRAVRALVEDALGTLWIATDAGLFGLERGAPFARRIALDGDASTAEVLGVAARPDGGCWAYSGDPLRGGGVIHAVDAAGRIERSAPVPPLGGAGALVADLPRGRLWLAPGVVIDAARLERIEAGAPGDAPLPQCAWAASEGELWLGGDRGLFRQRAPGAALVDATAALAADDWLGRYVRSLLLDRAGGLWVGTYAGVMRFDPHARPFDRLEADAGDSTALPAPAVSSIAEASDAVWVGTLGGGFARLGADGRVAERFSRRIPRHSSLPSDVVWHLAPGPDGSLFVATEAGLARYYPRERRLEAVRPTGGDWPAPPPRVVHLAWEAERRLWIASHSGLFALDPVTGAVAKVEVPGPAAGPNRHNVDALALDRDRELLWAGTRRGVVRVELESLRVESVDLIGEDGAPLESEGVFDLALSADGALWIGSGAGLTRLDTASGGQRHFRTRDGLPGSIVYSLLEDAAGALWLGTNRGIAHYDPERGSFRGFDRGDGLASFEHNRHAALRLGSGELVFGGTSGLTRFRPEAVGTHPVPPPVRLTEIERFGAHGVRRESALDKSELVLGPGDDGFVVRFAALGFFRPERNRYRCRLVGFDRDWVDAGDRGEARYARLPPGSYRFEAIAANLDGVWSVEPATLAVRARPPFHRTLVFRLGVAALAVALLAVGYRSRVARLVALERLRVTVASDLHDELSSNLAGIAVAAELAAARSAAGERARLAEIRATALAMVDAVRDTVWAIDPEHDSVEALERRLRHAARALLGELPVVVEIKVAAGLGLGMETRRHLYLAAKEMLHNVSRHAAATRVSLRFVADAREFRLEVEDDGRGFDPRRAATGAGLASLERRARKLGARLTVDSAVGRGTRIVLAGALPRTRDHGRGGVRRKLASFRDRGGPK